MGSEGLLREAANYVEDISGAGARPYSLGLAQRLRNARERLIEEDPWVAVEEAEAELREWPTRDDFRRMKHRSIGEVAWRLLWWTYWHFTAPALDRLASLLEKVR